MRRLPVLSLAVFALSCADKLPTAPSDLLMGIVVYEHANFEGASGHITKDISDLQGFDGPCERFEGGGVTGSSTIDYSWNDCISSVRVAPGWSATLYRDDGYRDDAQTITADMPNLQVASHDCSHDGLNDCVTSVSVRRLP